MGVGGYICVMTSVFAWKHLANGGLDGALNAFFGEMCTPRCDTCFMSILVGISLVMTFVSALMVVAVEFTRYPSERSFESTVVFFYALLMCVVFLSFAAWFGVVEPRFFS